MGVLVGSGLVLLHPINRKMNSDKMMMVALFVIWFPLFYLAVGGCKNV
jgi:hypothetical protein